MLTRNQIIDFLKTNKQLLETEFGIVRIGVFGSYAKDQHCDDSDIDIMVELNAPRFDLLANLHTYLESNLGKKIELIRKNKYTDIQFLKRIEKDMIYV